MTADGRRPLGWTEPDSLVRYVSDEERLVRFTCDLPEGEPGEMVYTPSGAFAWGEIPSPPELAKGWWACPSCPFVMQAFVGTDEGVVVDTRLQRHECANGHGLLVQATDALMRERGLVSVGWLWIEQVGGESRPALFAGDRPASWWSWWAIGDRHGALCPCEHCEDVCIGTRSGAAA